MVFLPRFYFALAAAILLALSAAWLPGGMILSICLTLLLTGAVLTDIVFIPRAALGIQRRTPLVLRQSQPFQVELKLLNQGEYAASFQVIDSPPPEFSGSIRPI